MKKILLILLLLFMPFSGAFAKDKVKAVASMTTDFSINEIPEEVEFQTTEDIPLEEDVVIPKNSIVTVTVVDAQKALRWHKSGFILCKIKSFQPITAQEPVDISDLEIYTVLRRYEKVYAKEATLLGTEIVLAQAASFFAPGVDILYFFTRGAIKRTTHPHWFKAGVSYAYENSICWIWLKGKPIELDVDDKIQVKKVTEEKALKIQKKVEKRKNKMIKKQQKKELKLQKKLEKEEQKRLKKEEKQKEKAERLLSV